MQLKYGLVVSFVAALTSLVSCNDQLDSRGLFSSLISTKIAVNVNFNDLKLQLSVSAELYLPGTDAFENVVSRWSNANTPSANVVVIPSNEADVQKIIRFANKNSLPFLAVSGFHGSISTLGDMDNGIQIVLSKLNSVKIASDGKSATFGGGIKSKALTDALWAAGKQTVTGTCECVSYIGPGLGGGHGWLQGRYGLISDQYISMRIVLANGDVKVATKNDVFDNLFWSMKGAGHNFGIVTEVTSKIYDVQRPNYALQTLIFSGDKVEQVYDLANKLWYASGTKGVPVDLINWSYWFYEPMFDAAKPVIAFYLIQEGATKVDSAYVKPFADLGPILNIPTSGTYLDLGKWTGISVSDTPCQITGKANPRFPIYLKQYSPQAQAKVYELFKNATTAPGTPFSQALFMFEGYPMQAVQALGDSSSAFAYRTDNLLVAPLLTYTPTGADVAKQAETLGNKMRQVLYEASGQGSLHSYVNYAYGNEGKGSWYGDDSWRQIRLRLVKTLYDPWAKFNFYAPIA